MVSSLRFVYFYVSQSVFTFGLLSSPGWLFEYSSTLLFIITLFSLPIRFQVLTLPNVSPVDISLMIPKHPRDVTRRTIFVGGIAWIEILQLMGCAPVLSILKAEALFPSFFAANVCLWHLRLYNTALSNVNQIYTLSGSCLTHLPKLYMITWEEWKIL